MLEVLIQYLAGQCLKKPQKEGIDLNIGIVTGDDLIPELPKIEKFGITELDTGNPFPESCLSINAYLGAQD